MRIRCNSSSRSGEKITERTGEMYKIWSDKYLVSPRTYAFLRRNQLHRKQKTEPGRKWSPFQVTYSRFYRAHSSQRRHWIQITLIPPRSRFSIRTSYGSRYRGDTPHYLREGGALHSKKRQCLSLTSHTWACVSTADRYSDDVGMLLGTELRWAIGDAEDRCVLFRGWRTWCGGPK